MLVRWVVLILVLLGVVAPTTAHGYIVRAIPEEGATLDRAPARVQYWFSEDLEPDFSSLTLRDQRGTTLATGGVDTTNEALMSLRVPQNLPDGAYIVDLRLAFASDGHVLSETRVFFVGDAISGVAGSSRYQVIPLEIVWRVIVLSATLLLFGGFVLYTLVLVPAWGSAQYPFGLLPERVMRALNRWITVALIAAFAGNILALVQQSMAFFNTDAGTVLAQGLWNVTRAGSRFGDVWNARMALLALVAVLHGVSITLRDHRQYPEMIRPLWAGNVWVMALVLGTFSITSHAAGSLLLPWVGVMVDMLHAVAVGAWVGGLALLVLILPVALQPYSGDSRRLALLAALRRFSRLAAGALAVVIATGVYSSLNWLNEPAELTTTAWGGALTIKVLLVAGLLGIGVLHQIAAHPERYARLSHAFGSVGRLAVTLRLEVLLAVVILVAVAHLSASPVPRPREELELTAPHATQTVDAFTIRMTMSPGGAGVNTLDIQVTPDTNGTVQVQLVNPAEDRRGEILAAERVDSGLYAAATGDVDEEGRWLALVDVVENGALHRAAFDWNITGDAIPQRNPTLANATAFAGVIAACVWAIVPLLRRLYRWLDWSPASMATASIATVITAALLVLGYVIVQRGEADYEATVNPPPQVVNNVLPDAESLREGESLFQANCRWRESSRDANRLRSRIPQLRDEELLAVVRDGCGALDDVQRWHIVNYLRVWK